MKCTNCGGSMTSIRTTHRYTESGLSDVTLGNVEVRNCRKCGEREIVIPKIEQLHQLIAQHIAETAPLNAERVRFLRKWLGFSTGEFARVTGVRPETVSRWESAAAGYPTTQTVNHFLRLLVAYRSQSSIDLQVEIRPRARTTPLKLGFRGSEWKAAA